MCVYVCVCVYAYIHTYTHTGVEKDLAIRAAKYTGKAKLDLLQSSLLKKAAGDHAREARNLREEVSTVHACVCVYVCMYMCVEGG